MTGVAKAVVSAILPVGWSYKRTLAANRQRVSSPAIRVVLYYMSDAI